MSTLTCIETYIDKNKNHYGCFIIEPLEIGQGITLGNTLRRTLLSDLNGYAISGVRINNLKHEFSVIEGLREDVLEVILNLKEMEHIPSIQFASKYSSKKELETFLRHNCKAYLPSYKHLNVYYYRELIDGSKKVSYHLIKDEAHFFYFFQRLLMLKSL